MYIILASQHAWQYRQGFLTKSEYRNPKSQTIPKSECQKFKTNADYYLDFMFFLKFGFLLLKFVSYFDIRISEFPVSDKWIKCNHFERISFCQFGILNLWEGALVVNNMKYYHKTILVKRNIYIYQLFISTNWYYYRYSQLSGIMRNKINLLQ